MVVKFVEGGIGPGATGAGKTGGVGTPTAGTPTFVGGTADLSTEEKLASKNPATAAEGRRELSLQTPTQQTQTVSSARRIATQFSGTASFKTVFERTKGVMPGTVEQIEVKRVEPIPKPLVQIEAPTARLPTVTEGKIIGVTPEGFQIKTAEISQTEFLRTARVRDPFLRRVEEREIELTAKELSERGGLFATAIRKGTEEKFVLIGGELVPEKEKIKAIEKELIIERRPEPEAKPAIQPLSIGAAITEVPITRKLAGKFTELITRDRLKLPEELILEVKRKLPIIDVPFQKFLGAGQFGLGIFPTEKGIGFGIRDPLKQAIEQQKAFAEIDRAIGKTVIGIENIRRLEKFTEVKKEQALSEALGLLAEPSTKQVGQFLKETGKLALGELALSTAERPITTTVEFAAIGGAFAVAPKLTLAGLGALTVKDIIAEPTLPEKIVTGTTSALTFGGFILGGVGLKRARKLVGFETIKIPFERRLTILETKPLEPVGEPVKLLKVIGKERQLSKEINKELGIKEKVTVKFMRDPFSKKLEKVEVVERVPIIEKVKIPIDRKGDVLKRVEILTQPFKTKAEVDILGLELGTRGLPLGKKVKVLGEPAKISPVSKVPKFPFKAETLIGRIEPPITATGAKARRAVFGFKPQEIARERATIELIRTLGREKGLKDLDVEFTVPGIEKPEVFQRIVERRTKQFGGQFFGTVTTRGQLPRRFQKVELGDIDIQFTKSLRKTEKIGKKITKDLEKAGEQVEFKPKELAIFSGVTGKKIIELKPGKGGPGEQMADAVFGRGLEEKRPVRFGKFYSAEATRAGTQLARKGAAVSFLRPPIKEVTETPLSFQVAGLFPRAKRFKDLPDFVAQAAGLIEIRKQPPVRATGIGRIIREERTGRARRSYKEFIKSFTKQQQRDLQTAVKESTKGGIKIPIKIESPKPRIKVSGTVVSPKPPKTPTGRVISPKVSKKQSLKVASVISKQVSPKPSPLSRKQVSKSLGTGSPSLKISPSLSLISPSISKSISPSISISPFREPRTLIFRRPKQLARVRKAKAIKLLLRPTRRQPSLVAIAKGITIKKPKKEELFTGLGIRPIIR